MKTFLQVNDTTGNIHGIQQTPADSLSAAPAGFSHIEVANSVFGTVFSDSSKQYKWDTSSRSIKTESAPTVDPGT